MPIQKSGLKPQFHRIYTAKKIPEIVFCLFQVNVFNKITIVQKLYSEIQRSPGS